MYSETRFRKSALRSAVLLALSINGAALALSDGAAHAANQACADPVNSDSANFTMLTPAGYTMGADGGTNDATFVWNGTAYTASSDYTGPGSASNATLASSDPFFGSSWVAHDIQVFGPGSYSFDPTLGGGAGETGTLNATVPAGHLGMHMLFDWSGNNNIDVFIVVAPNGVFGAGIGRGQPVSALGTATNRCDNLGLTATAPIKNCLFDGKPTGSAGKPLGSQVWMLTSIDGDSNGVMGIPMPTDGPFPGFNANFNLRGTLTLTPGTVCNPTADTLPDQFTFTDVPSGATPNTVYESNTITVSGLGVNPPASGITAPISISGGEYSVSVDGGTTWLNYSTSTPATVANGDMVKVRQTSAVNEDGTRTDTTLNIGGVFDIYSVTVVDKKPDAFSFTDQTGVSLSTPVESNAITIGGMDAGVNTPINITGGTYSINGGAPTSTAGTVQNGDVIRVQQTSSASSAATTIATLTLGSAGNGTLVNGTFSVRTAGGVSSTGNNFTMLDPVGGTTGGTNDVVMAWDQQFNTSTSDPVTPATAHMQLSSVTPFFQFNWSAHHIRVFGPGSYTINVDCTVAQLEAGTCAPNADPSRNYAFTVGAGQVAAHMLFDWNTTKNIDVVNIWTQTATFSPSPLYTGPQGFNASTTVWDFMSSDANVSCPGAIGPSGRLITCAPNGDNGVPMLDGPFTEFSANFNINLTGSLTPTNYTPTVAVGDPSGAKGCSISPTPVSTMNRADWWLVAGFLAWMGVLRKRFRRQAQS